MFGTFIWLCNDKKLSKSSMDKSALIFEFGQEIPRTQTEDLKTNNQIHKGHVLCKRKSIHELLKDEKKRLVLPNIASTTTNEVPQVLCKKGQLKKGYTFARNNNTDREKSNLNDEDVERILLLTSLETSLDIADKNMCNSKQSIQDTEVTPEHEAANVKTAIKDGHYSVSSTKRVSEEPKIMKERKQRHSERRTHNAFVKRSQPKDIGASMCTQSFNSLCTELTMFKDTFKTTAVKTTSVKPPRDAQTSPYSPSRSSSVQSSTFALFRNRRRSLVTSSQESRLAMLRRSSTRSMPSHIQKSEEPHKILAEGIHYTRRKESSASEGITCNDCCVCAKQPHVHFNMKNESVGNANEKTEHSQEDFDCYSPNQIKLNKTRKEFPNRVDNPPKALSLPRIPCKAAVVETYMIQRATSDPDVSPRVRTKIARTSHEWPEDRTIHSPSKQTLINCKCNEWLDRWVQNN